MKLAPRDLARYVGALGAKEKAALVFGDDRGAVREFAERIARAVCPDLGDPFRVTVLDGAALADDPRRLADEMGALALTGGRRLVWLREMGERQRGMLESALETLTQTSGDSAFLLVEAGELAYRSALRQLFEDAPAAAAVACESGRAADVEGLIRDVLSQTKRNIAPPAFAALVARLGADRALARGALEGLAQYMASAPANAVITLDDVRAAVPDAGEAELDDIINTLLDGARAALDDALARAFDGGASPVGLIRIALRNFQRVHWVLRQAEDGVSPDQAIARLRPPLPRFVQSAFAARCRRWTPRTVERALERLMEAELRCKTTALPEQIVCAEAFLAIAGLGARVDA